MSYAQCIACMGGVASKKSGVGAATVIDKAKILANDLDSPLKISKSLVTIRKTLTQSAMELRRFGFWDQATGVHAAWVERIQGMSKRIDSVANEFDSTGPTVPVRQKTALGIIQTAQLLDEIRKAAEQSELENSFEEQLKEFGRAMKQIIGVVYREVVVPAAKAFPSDILWALVAFVGIGLVIAIAK